MGVAGAIGGRGRLRRIWFLIHMWIGVGLSLVLIPLSLSGSYLVWRDEIDRAAHPARFAVGTQPASLEPSAYLGAAQAGFGDRAQVSSLRLPARPGEPVIVTGQIRPPSAAREGDGPAGARDPRSHAPRARPQSLTAWIDPATARVLEVANLRKGASMWMHDLHGQLFVFGAGRQVVGWLGVLMLVSCISGVWLWWPRAGALHNGLRWRRGPGVLINLHYMVGFWVAIPLAALSLTGALISFQPFTRAVVGAFAPVSPPQAARGGPLGGGGAPLRRTRLTADQAAAAAAAAAPGARLASLTLPTRGPGEPAWRIQLRQPGHEPLTLMVDDATGAAAPAPGRTQTSGDEMIRLNRRIHDGDDTPLVWKLLITVVGAAPALLGVTGVIVWARSQLRKSGMRRRLAEPQPAA